MPKEIRMLNDQKAPARADFIHRTSTFFRHSSFVIRHWTDVIRYGLAVVGLLLSSIQAHTADKNLIGYWLFDQNHVKGQTVKGRVGKQDATIDGDLKLKTEDGPHALVFDGRRASVIISRDIKSVALPKQQLTAEAWVVIDKPQQWGGIIG